MDPHRRTVGGGRLVDALSSRRLVRAESFSSTDRVLSGTVSSTLSSTVALSLDSPLSLAGHRHGMDRCLS